MSKWIMSRFFILIHHHHHVAPSAQISLTLSLSTPPYRPSLSAGPQGYIPYRHRAAVCMFQPGRPAFAQLCEEVHKRTSLMSSSLLLQQCPACLVCLILIVFMTGGRYSCCFVGCCLQDLINIARRILV